MTQGLSIGVDMDGVLVGLLDEWLDAYHDAGGERLYASDIPKYSWENYVADRELFLKILKSASIFASAKPMPGALEGLRQLRDQHDVTLVTTVFGTRATDAKRGWIFRYVRPDIRTEDIIFCRDKWRLSLDVLVEDSPKNLDKWLAAHPRGWGYIITQPYNRTYSHPRCTRVKSLLDVALSLECQHAA